MPAIALSSRIFRLKIERRTVFVVCGCQYFLCIRWQSPGIKLW